MDIRVAYKTIPSLVLGEDSEPPLRPSIWLIAVQRLQLESYQTMNHKNPPLQGSTVRTAELY